MCWWCPRPATTPTTSTIYGRMHACIYSSDHLRSASLRPDLDLTCRLSESRTSATMQISALVGIMPERAGGVSPN